MTAAVIDLLSIGVFPDATNSELARRFAVTRYFQPPAPGVRPAGLRPPVTAGHADGGGDDPAGAV